MLVYELSGGEAQSYWINISFTVKKSRLISSPDREPTAVATRPDNRMPIKMMRRNLMMFPFSDAYRTLHVHRGMPSVGLQAFS